MSSTFVCTIQGAAIFFLAFGIGMWVIHFMAFFWSKWKLHRKRSWPADIPLPGVSIIKPLVGEDPHLASNLETFFTLNYPKFEILFCVQDNNDPAINIVDKLMDKYPTVDARLFKGGEKVGINPKINNMQPAYISMKHELILISDSGIRMKEDTLLDMVCHMDDKTGLVHQMPFTCDRQGFPAILEKVYFGTSHARIYLAADLVGINCPTGMSALMRKKLLDEVGGIKAFGCFLAEDYFFAKSITDRGWKITISSQPAWQNSGYCDIQSFQSRISRWAKLRFAMVPPTILAEPFSECMVLGICVAFATRVLLRWDPIVVFLIHLLTWCIMDWFLLRSVQNGNIPFTKFEFVLAWLFREASAPFLFIHSLMFPNIHWRQGYYRLQWGGRVEEIAPKVKL
ncbi:unnamed protein product [Orchesella dallaii]|uniref:ceramide glucosyltransferase n=1 Tax=Orchesella dallaii TaxID=48710 RepID=A0ABP1RSH8_9HEXA